MHTYGTIVMSLISGSRIPLFNLVNLMDIQSESGPAVPSPIKAPINTARLNAPMQI